MRHHVALASLFFVCAGTGVLAQRSEPAAPTCANMRLVPAPRECTAVKEIPLGVSGVRVQSESIAEDEFASKDLQQWLAARGVGSDTGSSATVHFERVHGAHAKDLFGGNDEGYMIAPGSGRGLVVTAETSAGIFYGAQTVKQLIRGSGKDTVLLEPTLRDWPAMPHRGISDDWSRGPLPNMEFLKREIRTLAAYKINIFSPYFEHTFAYSASMRLVNW
jgi:N-acetyl-beta-hexosaminidase